MAERQSRNILGNFERRDEYHFLDAAQHSDLKESALGSIEDVLLVERATDRTGLFYTYTEGVSVRKLVLSHVDMTEEETMLFVNGYESDLRKVVRAPMSTDVTVRTKHYREGALQESAKVSVREFVSGSTVPFISRYLIERYAGDVLHATVARTDVMQSVGLDEREMLPYDFQEFNQQMNVIIAMRRGSLLGRYNKEVEV